MTAILVLLSPVQLSASFNDKEYSSTMQNAAKQTSEQLMRLGKEKQLLYDHKNALLIFAVVAGRYRPDMTDRQKALCVEAFMRSGNIYKFQTNFIDALDMYLQALEISESTPAMPRIMELYMYIGLIYCNMEDFHTGLMLLKKSYSLRNKYPDTKTEANLLSDLTAYSAVTGNIKEAWRYFSLSEKARPATDSVLRFRATYNKGLIYCASQKYREGIEEYHNSIRLTRDPRLICFVYERLYITYRSMNESDSTLHYLTLTNNLAKKLDINSLYLSSLKDLSDFYHQKNPSKSSKLKDLYLAIADSCYNRREFDRLKTKQFTHTIDAGRRRINALETVQTEREKSLRNQRRLLIAIGSGLLVALTLLIIVFQKKRALDKTYRDLYLSSRRALEAEKLSEEKFRNYENQITVLKSELSKKATTAASPKYSQSNLKDSHKDLLVNAIDELARDNDSLFQPDITLSSMARMLNTNSQYVSQVLNEVYGKSFTEFINEYRVKEACRRIADTDKYGNYSMEGIGESVGYKSKSTFFRVFHKVTGLSPSVYRRLAMQDARRNIVSD